MEIFDVGPMELIFLAALALIFLGPRRMSEAGTTIGRWLNKFVRSDTWIALKEVSNAIIRAPNRMMREANLEDLKRELGMNTTLDEAPTSVSFVTDRRAGKAVDNAILPPGRSVSFAPQPPARLEEAVIEEKKTPAKKSAPVARKKKVAKTSKKKTTGRATPKSKGNRRTNA